MLVIVHHRYVQLFFKSSFNFETFRCFYIFQIDTAEGGSDGFNSLNEFIGIFFFYFNVEYINTGINFKKQSFSFHYRLTAQCTNIAQTQYGCTIRDNRDQISFSCVFVRILRILFYFQTGFSHTRGVSQ